MSRTLVLIVAVCITLALSEKATLAKRNRTGNGNGNGNGNTGNNNGNGNGNNNVGNGNGNSNGNNNVGNGNGNNNGNNNVGNGNGNNNGNNNGASGCVNTGVNGRKLPNRIRRNGQTTLANLVALLNLTSTLNSAGPFTVFAPSNAAFLNSGLIGDLTLTPAQLTHTLLHHVVVGSNILFENVPQGSTVLNTAAGTQITVVRTNNSVTIDGYALVIQTDVKACNGVAHVIDHVLIPPCGSPSSLPTIADRTNVPALSTLRSLVLDRPIATALSSAGTFTVFAPIDSAFSAISGVVASLRPNQVTNVLLDHVISNARILASDLPLGTVRPTTLFNQEIVVTRSASGVTVAGLANTSPANVVLANVQACNGVVHVIDAVLIPTGL